VQHVCLRRPRGEISRPAGVQSQYRRSPHLYDYALSRIFTRVVIDA